MAPNKHVVEDNLMAKKGTRAYKDETVAVYYGINAKTFQVERVSRTRGGMISKSGAGGLYHSTSIHPSNARSPEREVRLVYGLTEVIETAPQFESSEGFKASIEALKKKAEDLRKQQTEKKKE